MCRKGAQKWIYHHCCTSVSKQHNLNFHRGRLLPVYCENINWYAMKSSGGSKELRLTSYLIFQFISIYASYFYGMMWGAISAKKIMQWVTSLTFLFLKSSLSFLNLSLPWMWLIQKSLELCSAVEAEQSYWQEIASAIVYLKSIWLRHF